MHKKAGRPLFVGMIIIEIIFMLKYWDIRKSFEGEKCIADIFRYTVSSQCFPYLILLFIMYYLFITRDEYNSMYVVKMKSKKYIWIKNVLNDIKVIVPYIIMLMLMNLVIAKYIFGNIELINWDSYLSNYYFFSKNITNINIAFVIFKAYLLMFFQMLVCMLFTRLVIWITNIRLLPIIFIVVMIFNDIHMVYFPLFFNRFLYKISEWGGTSIMSYANIMKLLLIAVIMFVIGLMYSEHREFIEDEHI